MKVIHNNSLRRRSDRGMTLMELLVASTLVGLLTTAITGLLFTITHAWTYQNARGGGMRKLSLLTNRMGRMVANSSEILVPDPEVGGSGSELSLMVHKGDVGEDPVPVAFTIDAESKQLLENKGLLGNKVTGFLVSVIPVADDGVIVAFKLVLEEDGGEQLYLTKFVWAPLSDYTFRED